MPVILEQDETLSRLRLEGSIAIAGAAELKTELAEALERALPVSISLESAAEIDVTGVQLFLAASRAFRSAGLAFTLDGELPEQLLEPLHAAGLDLSQAFAESGVTAEVLA